MVGFNMIKLWVLLITMIVITGCIPQSKTTECKENEAFNAIQRRCLPVNPNETSFIKIKSPVPTAGITIAGSSGSPISFTVMIENPYKKNYRLQWLRNFNGVQSTLYSPSAPSADLVNHPYQISLVPSADLFGAIGTHVITAQVLDATNNNVIDSHAFTLNLTSDPTPYGQGFSPSLSVPLTFSTASSNTVFAFDVLRNGRAMNTPTVSWRLVKLTGTALAPRVEVDTLVNTESPQNVTFAFNPTNPMNDMIPPSAPYLAYVGNYRLEASIVDGTTTFSTYYWDITIKHPDLGQVVVANNPVPGDAANSVRAFNGIPYGNMTLPNFSYNNSLTRSQFCVQVSDPDGRYGNGVHVRYYLGNSTGHVYQGLTTGADDTICLEDASAAIKNTIVFSDPNPDLSWSTQIKARVFDAQTGEEYTTFVAGVYPLVWNVQVEPTNKPPVLTFVDAGAVACTSTIVSTKNGCAVTQSNDAIDNFFNISFQIQDEHYTDAAEFAYTATLSRGAVVVDSSCQKAFGVAGGPTFTCQLKVPSYDALGSIDPTLDAWRVSVNVTDSGSPFTATQKSSTLIWNLSVREINYRPIINNVMTYQNLVATTTFSEKDTATFQVQMTDPERDEYIIELARCGATLADADCTTLQTTTRTFLNQGDYLTNRRLNYTIPDGFIGANVLSQTVKFRIKIINYASTLDPLIQLPNEAISSIDVTINNWNPAPVYANINAIDTKAPTMSDPLGIDYWAFGSFPLTLDPGTITDASEYAPEGNITYQWWIAPHSMTPTWTQIGGGNTRILRWTPGTTMASGNYFIKLCVTDGYPTRSTVDPNGGATLCNNPAIVSVYNNFLTTAPLNVTTSGQIITNAPAVWIDTSATGNITTGTGSSKIIYTAYVTHDSGAGSFRIHVQKSIYNIDDTGRMQVLGELDFDAINPLEQDASFNILDVKDLRLIGDDNSLYIAYLANFVNDDHDLGYKPEIRRIYKGINRGLKVAPNLHNAPFAFNYEGFYANHTGNAPAACNCWTASNINAANLQVTGGQVDLQTANVSAGSTITLGYDGATYPLSIVVSGTDQTQRALQITSAINSHPQLGFTATNDGLGTVTIYGPKASEEARVHQLTNKLGKLWMDSNYLYVPYINLSQAAPNNKVIAIETVINDSASELSLVASGPGGMTSTLLAGTFTNDFDNAVDHSGNLLIAYANNIGEAKLIKFTGFNFAANNTYNLMASKNIQKIRMSASNVNNNYYYVMGEDGTNTMWMTRVESNLPTADFTRVWSLSATNDAASASLVSSLAGQTYDFAIKTAGSDTFSGTLAEARVLISSSLGVFAFKTLSNNTVTCGSCEPVSRVNATLPVTAPLLAVSDIVENQTIGSPGNQPGNENQRDILIFGYINESNSGDTFNTLSLGLINTERTVISSTTRDTTNGRYAPAVFKN
jgi:hypothetical protein